MQDRFEECCDIDLRRALDANHDVLGADAKRDVLAQSSINTKLRKLFSVADKQRIPLYVLIDEYDNVANAVMARHGEAAYQSLTHDAGFYRSFFATLKTGTDAGALERLFITSVSPVAMDDVTSGFNIGRNLSLDPRFKAMLGFTKDEV